MPRRALLLTLAALPMGGCIIQEMHDDLRATRQGVEHLAALAPELQRTNELLAQTNAQLAEMQGRVRRIDDQLQHLETMDRTMARLDEHLAALRKVIENVDRLTPGKLTKDTPPATMPGEAK